MNHNCIYIKIHSFISVRSTKVTQLTLITFITLKTRGGSSSHVFFFPFFWNVFLINVSGFSSFGLHVNAEQRIKVGLSFKTLPTAPGRLAPIKSVGPHVPVSSSFFFCLTELICEPCATLYTDGSSRLICYNPKPQTFQCL